MKKILVLVMTLAFYGCAATNPPEAPQAKGDWHSINTDLEAVKKGTY
ncbi:TPA: hypothetical protein MYP60_005312 [Citrobacter farmeri]|jgi:hypothetical protein|uniref:Conjugal transfer protein n=1 Tax=Aeromonas veronii TaxID=654 RepID=A1YBN5_AERVE|nr:MULTISPECIES: hypothetical protein [Gammaproteobacteria]ABI83643.1 conjugal transfer protein [Aeromonas veronii]EHW5331728.1 hypothetical protein [Escherichia coli]MDV2387318.1 hypothetical protein [Vibrio cholerae]HCB1657213.1 hypothetical protein [Citrobacter farmeri]